MKEKIFKCYSRKLMYFLGLYDVSYIERKFDDEKGFPYWTFPHTDELDRMLVLWNEWKNDRTRENNQYINK